MPLATKECMMAFSLNGVACCGEKQHPFSESLGSTWSWTSDKTSLVSAFIAFCVSIFGHVMTYFL